MYARFHTDATRHATDSDYEAVHKTALKMCQRTGKDICIMEHDEFIPITGRKYAAMSADLARPLADRGAKFVWVVPGVWQHKISTKFD